MSPHPTRTTPVASAARRRRRNLAIVLGLTAGLVIAACTVPRLGNGQPGSGGPTDPNTSMVPGVAGQSKGLWISTAELMALPMSGPSWDRLVEQAEQDPGPADISDQDSNHDVLVLAEALVAVRAGRADLRRSAIDGLLEVIGTDDRPNGSCEWKPNIARSLAVGRNLSAYVIAADVLGLYPDGDPASAGSRFGAWVDTIRHKPNCPHTDSGSYPDGDWFDLSQFHDWSASNVSSMAGGSRVAAALYMGDDDEVRAAWQTFRRVTGDRTAGAELDFNDNGLTWSSTPFAPVAINPPGAIVDGHDVDGALVNDIGRGGAFAWPPGHTQYPWEGLAGLFVQAELFERAGFPAYEQQQQALLRAVMFMRRLADEFGEEWWDHSAWVKYVCNRAYGTSLPVTEVGAKGKNMAWTDWTHGPGRMP